MVYISNNRVTLSNETSSNSFFCNDIDKTSVVPVVTQEGKFRWSLIVILKDTTKYILFYTKQAAALVDKEDLEESINNTRDVS